MFKHLQTGNALKTVIFFTIIFYLGKILDPYNQGQLSVVLMYFVGILSITFLTGLSGQISLGQGALMAVGGYTCALVVLNLGLNEIVLNNKKEKKYFNPSKKNKKKNAKLKIE